MTVEGRPPGRALLRLAGVLTQLCCALCLLVGTIAFVLVQQNKAGGAAYVIAWSVAALGGLVVGGLMGRGGLVGVIASALIDAGFGVVLLALDDGTLRGLVTMLPASDLAMLGQILAGLGGAMVAIAILCVATIPQALRHARWRQQQADAPAATAAFAAVPPHLGATRPSRPSALGGSGEPPHAGATAKGWAPPTAQLSVWNLPAVTPAERRSRRRIYLALGGFAVGFGAGIGVLMSSSAGSSTPSEPRPPAVAAVTPITPGAGSAAAAPTTPAVEPGSGSASDGPVGEGGALEDVPSAQRFVETQRVAIAKGDVKALTAMLAPSAFGFGIDAEDFAGDRAGLVSQLHRALAEPPADGFAVEEKLVAIGEEGTHAWIALEVVLSAPDQPDRRFAITELATIVDRRWQIVAWHWAIPVPDATAERHAILGTLPRPAPVPDVATAPPGLVAAARAALSSRAAFAAARSERADGFNFGSAPGERVVGGERVKQLFTRLRAQIAVHDGVRVHAVSETVGIAAANVDFTSKTRAATDLTQTFRVLAVFVKEGAAWRLVQTQWSHGGPIR